MSSSLRIPNEARLVVADAKKALFLSNVGDAAFPNLRVDRVINAADNPRTSDQGADRPGRSGFDERRSAVGQTDWHRQAEARFAAEVMAALAAEDQPRALILVAPPAFLAEMRHHLPAHLKSKVTAEIAKDLTHLSISEIEKNLSGS
jgi:protein required for attachment to host cells